MPKLATTDFDLSIAEEFLKRRKLRHLHAKRRADTLTLIAGPATTPGHALASASSPSSAGLSMWPMPLVGGNRLPSKRRCATFSISSPTPFPGCSQISNPERTSDRMY